MLLNRNRLWCLCWLYIVRKNKTTGIECKPKRILFDFAEQLCLFPVFYTIISSDKQKSDLFIQQLQSNRSDHLFFLYDFNIDCEQQQLQGP